MLAYHQWKDIKKLEADPQVKEERESKEFWNISRGTIQ